MFQLARLRTHWHEGKQLLGFYSNILDAISIVWVYNILYRGFFEAENFMNFMNKSLYVKILPSQCILKTFMTQCSWQFVKFLPWKVGIGQFRNLPLGKIARYMVFSITVINPSLNSWSQTSRIIIWNLKCSTLRHWWT